MKNYLHSAFLSESAILSAMLDTMDEWQLSPKADCEVFRFADQELKLMHLFMKLTLRLYIWHNYGDY